MQSFTFFVLSAIVVAADGTIIIHRTEIIQNNSVANIKLEYFNDNVHDTVINVIIENFVILNNIWIYIKIDISKNKNDQFDLNLVKAIMDLGNLFRGATANPIIKTVTDRMLKNTNFELKFPFRPVSLIKFNLSVENDNFIFREPINSKISH